MRKALKTIYEQLLQKYGEPRGQWQMWCRRPKTVQEKEEVMVGAVLTQRVNWQNVEKAILNLKSEGVWPLQGIYKAGQTRKAKLERLIRPSGFYKQKAKRLLGLAGLVLENYGDVKKMGQQDTAKLRQELLSLWGIGPETADDILLYALEKPVFVVDAYTKRLVRELGWDCDLKYEGLQKMFEQNLPRDYALYQDFHALIVIAGKDPTPLSQLQLV